MRNLPRPAAALVARTSAARARPGPGASGTSRDEQLAPEPQFEPLPECFHGPEPPSGRCVEERAGLHQVERIPPLRERIDERLDRSAQGARTRPAVRHNRPSARAARSSKNLASCPRATRIAVSRLAAAASAFAGDSSSRNAARRRYSSASALRSRSRSVIASARLRTSQASVTAADRLRRLPRGTRGSAGEPPRPWSLRTAGCPRGAAPPLPRSCPIWYRAALRRSRQAAGPERERLLVAGNGQHPLGRAAIDSVGLPALWSMSATCQSVVAVVNGWRSRSANAIASSALRRADSGRPRVQSAWLAVLGQARACSGVLLREHHVPRRRGGGLVELGKPLRDGRAARGSRRPTTRCSPTPSAPPCGTRRREYRPAPEARRRFAGPGRSVRR